MTRVYRGLLHAGAWTLTTAAAVALSWFGVHSVLRSTAYDLPRALPISTPSGILVPATSRPPMPSPTPRPHRTAPAPRPPTTTGAAALPPKTPPGTPHPVPSPTAATTATGSTGTSTSTSTGTPPGASSGDIRGYTVRGGRVVLDLTSTDASLVTATPAAGWKMQVWTQPGWLRVTFTSADSAASSSLFCTWNGHPPSVESYDN
ncbi:hypothetical protein ACFO3J_34245 [Streptomyces polygonati]|uniref:Secreted protein n=1 Tax=Streptomyces polygonati TaxID=1617087 RepID=A0ABV8HZT7_9ACTN